MQLLQLITSDCTVGVYFLESHCVPIQVYDNIFFISFVLSIVNYRFSDVCHSIFCLCGCFVWHVFHTVMCSGTQSASMSLSQGRIFFIIFLFHFFFCLSIDCLEITRYLSIMLDVLTCNYFLLNYNKNVQLHGKKTILCIMVVFY